MPKRISTSEAAAYLGITRAGVLRLINAKNQTKRLPARRCECGAEWIIKESDLKQFAATDRRPGRPRKEKAK